MRRLRVLCLLAGLAACHSPPPPAPPAAKFSAASFPGRYEGVLPCADCEGIRTRIDFMASGQYLARETYLGKSALEFQDRGRWVINVASGHVQLDSGRRSYSRYFRGISAAEIRLLDRDGRELDLPVGKLTLRRVP